MKLLSWLRHLVKLCVAYKDQEQILRTMFDHMFEFIGLCLPDGTIIDANKAIVERVKHVYSVKEEDLFGVSLWDVPWWKSRQQEIRDLINQSIKTKMATKLLLSHVRNTGEEIFVDVSITPVISDCGEIKYLVVEGRDVTERVIQTRHLEQLDKITKAFTSSGGFENVIPNVLSSLIEIFGCDRVRILKFNLGKPITADVAWHKGIPPYDTEMVKTKQLVFNEQLYHAFQNQIETGEPISLTGSNVPPSLQEIDVKSLMFVPLKYEQTSGLKHLLWGIVIHQCSYERIWSQTELKLFKEAATRIKEVMKSYMLYERVHTHAYYDSVTTLPNRHYFQEKVQYLINRQKEHDHCEFTIFLVDLDNFKRINDTQGHHVGDLLLKEVALRLQRVVCERCEHICQVRNLKIDDNCSCFVARLGGDEFVIILEHLSKIEEIVPIAEVILDEFKYPAMGVHVTSSIGISICPDDGDSISTLLKSADLAMYAAKENGKNQYLFHDSSMNRTVEEFVRYEQLTRKMIFEDSFALAYQPIVDLNTGDIVAVEILLRLPQEPEFEGTRVDKTIQIAEETGMITTLGMKILEKACSSCVQCSLYDTHGVPVSVNLSIVQLEDDDIVKKVEDIIKRTGFNPEKLTLEITETVFMTDFEENARKLHKLKKLGVGVSIDDFGKGYSSLNYLQQLPISKLKIDMDFVRNMIADTKSMEIVKGIISIANSLGLIACAEGVETEEQLKLLKDLGCDQVQGFYCYKPMTQERLKQVLLDNLGSCPVSDEQI